MVPSSEPPGDAHYRPFKCQHPGCTATYRRKEHLTRHAVRHSQDRVLKCDECGSVFDRSDTLRRHKKVHGKDNEPSVRVSKACNRCRTQKTRCDGNFPCGACLKKGISCSFGREGQSSGQQKYERDENASTEGDSHSSKRRRLNSSYSPIVDFTQGREDGENALSVDASDGAMGSTTVAPVAFSDCPKIKEKLLQHEERLRREGMHLALETPTHPQTEGSPSRNYLKNQVHLDDDDAMQPIDTEYYASLYFAHFHPQWPFLHEQSFRHKHDPPVLVLAVVMIGLWVTGEARARRLAWKIHARLHVLLKEQIAVWDISKAQNGRDNARWPMATYQSILLYTIFAMVGCSGSKDNDCDEVLNRIRPILTSLIETCRAKGLFFYPAMLAQCRPDDPIIYSWTHIEEAKRFALALFKFASDPRMVPPAGPAVEGRGWDGGSVDQPYF
ncbi:hypothetical protein VTN00DRAFT_7869 [Thermoascus crustaceus]|uniref:uncharacterized protein n=1 Tax=Thermoascus crustaceus TaxID=5088 RepID=UPI003743CE04